MNTKDLIEALREERQAIQTYIKRAEHLDARLERFIKRLEDEK